MLLDVLHVLLDLWRYSKGISIILSITLPCKFAGKPLMTFYVVPFLAALVLTTVVRSSSCPFKAA